MAKKKNATKAEVVASIDSLRRELVDLRFQHGVGKLLNTASLKKIRHDLARALTAKNADKSV